MGESATETLWRETTYLGMAHVIWVLRAADAISRLAQMDGFLRCNVLAILSTHPQ